MLKLIYTNSFEHDIKIALLSTKSPLPVKYRDHNLIGNFIGRRERHIEPDWLLIYKIDEDSIIFERTGTHSDLF
ncbi:MAG: type II toxin-antitoxin system YafQ family toxin [Rickettsia endosymbiont of Ixodes persulcatus]|nr:type II toxin-antitoxin system YafQ family toxin [Rickettsia endosymbiont of Ixodes persulcatus]MCZ6903698.1 type II toxin-antitoxin system YafQ family toxin [Rickettsia endosymbiont of Ixodes persulcatus]MCZ6909029.1 type II toxin-antitoxin system YafQ family toxin [Rickettsia endosymbiont of Ixodes persulcatus]MCZ6909892.1 type II toxin-antitoxin system YafQ family toxin [Rickettsia endosymbiont of Ixodes persulcatus]MCZ6914699.1 type II toxin-antitoxin system YafQ family toxin [Rickettsia